MRCGSTKRQTTVPTEAEEAKILCQWMKAKGIWFIHIANEGRRSFKAARSLQAQGLTAGVPDYLILSEPSSGEGGQTPVWIELKRRKGGRVSKAQAEFVRELEFHGYAVAVCNGADEAISYLGSLGY